MDESDDRPGRERNTHVELEKNGKVSGMSEKYEKRGRERENGGSIVYLSIDT